MNENKNQCMFTLGCPVYKHFSSEGIKRLFILQYCESDFVRCERFILKMAGKEVPEKLLPNGDTLE
ncbi:MAG TPA: hypothetical protein PK747_10465 [Acidobacteriota bacterium]|nr:hypothetical protein [Acidobacteriota bacterium]HNT17727.1 hypothetical protein [Acidobacteriota bacterium]HQO19085.1 hypothetical protein [Acidobacteriota bacterium]HQQ47813.1 hypothetical protein [Acidobacteriota bacterium]